LRAWPFHVFFIGRMEEKFKYILNKKSLRCRARRSNFSKSLFSVIQGKYNPLENILSVGKTSLMNQ
jgi:hypothetical protein